MHSESDGHALNVGEWMVLTHQGNVGCMARRTVTEILNTVMHITLIDLLHVPKHEIRVVSSLDYHCLQRDHHDRLWSIFRKTLYYPGLPGVLYYLDFQQQYLREIPPLPRLLQWNWGWKQISTYHQLNKMSRGTSQEIDDIDLPVSRSVIVLIIYERKVDKYRRTINKQRMLVAHITRR